MAPSDYRKFKDRIFEQFARITSALASPRRLEIVDLLAQAERSVEDLARLAGLSTANASRHLQVLKAARLVETRREGNHVYYRLADPAVVEAWRAIRVLGETRLAEVDRVVRSFLEDRSAAEPVTAEELHRRLERGDVVVLDVRPEEEYRAGHIPGALSFPVERLESMLDELPAEVDVIAYCRGPYCVYSDQAVALLSDRGYRARRLELGLPDWRQLGYQVESGRQPMEETR